MCRQSKDSIKLKGDSISETKRNMRSTSVDTNCKKVLRNIDFFHDKLTAKKCRESQLGFKSYETQNTGRGAMSSERKNVRKR